MVVNDLITKIKQTVSKKEALEETDVRSLMILMRKLLDQMQDSYQQSFLIIRLYANWAVHNEITKSNPGLRILSAINELLVTFKSADTDILRKEISQGLGISTLRREMKLFFENIGFDDDVEIIRDVPLSFPQLSALDKTKRKIYDSITHNTIKPGAGVISIQITNVDYDEFGAKNIGKKMCLRITTEDTTTIIVPLEIDVRI